MNFAEAAKREGSFTFTENGAKALNTTGFKLLDLFGSIGSLRSADQTRIERLFADAYNEDPLVATKMVFYARDIREGLGERNVFKILLKYIASHHPEALINNIQYIGEYGRFDDLYALIDTPLENQMWEVMNNQFKEDLKNLDLDQPISLLAKWIKTPDASSPATRALGILTAKKLGYDVYTFKRILRKMRKKINIVEASMSANKWSEINYSAVPSRASMIYRKAFGRHDGDRYTEFINRAVDGQEKINSSTLYPYDLIEKIISRFASSVIYDPTVEAQWKQLPNYIEEETNALVIADTSGSMNGRPICTSIGLAIYFAERNKGAYHNMWMSFSDDPRIHILKGETLAQKIASMDMNDWMNSTNLEAAFKLVLDIAINNHISADEMPKSLIVISDMEINTCTYNDDWIFYDQMQAMFAEAGYEIPNIIFWNVNSRHDIFHSDGTRKGVQLASGQSTTVFKQILSCVGLTPMEAMMKTINAERYDAITIAL